jgi:ABC-type glycerol-3-phosphate transport system substrate-binding protein
MGRLNRLNAAIGTAVMKILNFGRWTLGVTAAAALLAGCGGTQSSMPQTNVGVTAALNATSPSQEWLYVQTATTVYVYPLGASQPTREIPNRDVSQLPGPIAVSPVSGDLYVAGHNQTKNQIRYYTGSGQKLLGIITLAFPYGLTFDSKGNLYVVNGDAGPLISVFRPGSSTAAYTISPNITVARLAVDSADNLYAQLGGGCGTEAINVYSPGSRTPAYSITGLEILCVDDMRADPAGNLYLADTIDGFVLFYKHGRTTPSYKITNGIMNPYTLGVDSDGNLYVASASFVTSAGSIAVYAPGATSPTYSINERGQSLMSFAFAPAPKPQNLHVANFTRSVVSVYAPGTGAFLRNVAVPQQPLWIAIGK